MTPKTKTLLSERLTIKHLTLRDNTRYFDLVDINRERLEENFPTTLKHTKTKEKSKEHLEKLLKDRNTGRQFIFGIWNEKKLIGVISVFNLDWQFHQCELSYFIDQQYEKYGYTTEALKHLTRFLMEEWCVNKIVIRVVKDNIASQRVAIKAGFIKEQVVKNKFQNGVGEIVKVDYYFLNRKRKNLKHSQPS